MLEHKPTKNELIESVKASNFSGNEVQKSLTELNDEGLIYVDHDGTMPYPNKFSFDAESATRLRDGISDQFSDRYITPESSHKSIFEMSLSQYRFASRQAGEGRLLDVGCGDGYGSFFLSKRADSVIGVDKHAPVIETARKKYVASNLSFESSDALHLPYADSEFDAVTCLQVIERVDDHERALDEIVRVLKPRGRMIVSTPNHAMAHKPGLLGSNHATREFYLQQFRDILLERFSGVSFYAQGDYFSNIALYLNRTHGKRFLESSLPDDQLSVNQNSIHKGYLGSAMFFMAVCKMQVPNQAFNF